MANIQQLLNDEIRRLARKEVIALEKEYKSQLVDLRKNVSELKNRVKVLEKQLSKLQPAEPEKIIEAAEESAKTFRVTPNRIIKWRTALGLKRAQYARLLGVSPLSVAHWEDGKSAPRDAQKRRIAQLRDMGKRELTQLCKEQGVVLKKSPVDSAEK
ncbi:MAG: helix-turn-helix domain-containing protein [Lentisphaerae bacterium]|nr:helix-turn-helix domain-containing protein [Lentisphaerota bacterium]